MQNTRFAILSLAILAVTSTLGFSQFTGQLVPELGFEDSVQGLAVDELTREKLEGKVIYLEFWATWCGPCLASMPHLAELEDHFQDQPMEFLLVTDEERPLISKFLERRTLPGTVVLDTNRSLFKALDVKGIPRSVITDRSGKIVFDGHPDSVTVDILGAIIAGTYVQPVPIQKGASAKNVQLPDLARFFPGVDPLHIDYRDAGLIPKSPHTYNTIIRPSLVPEGKGPLVAFGENEMMGAGMSILGGTAEDILKSVARAEDKRFDFLLDDAQAAQRWDLVVSRPPGWSLDEARDEVRPAILRMLSMELNKELRTVSVITADLSGLQKVKGARRQSALDPMNDPDDRSYFPVHMLLELYEHQAEQPVIALAEEDDPWCVDMLGVQPWAMTLDEQRSLLEESGVVLGQDDRQLAYQVIRPAKPRPVPEGVVVPASSPK